MFRCVVWNYLIVFNDNIVFFKWVCNGWSVCFDWNCWIGVIFGLFNDDGLNF